jgi:hypothetical protein
MTAGKAVQIGPGEVKGLSAPGTTLFEGTYQWVNLDSGATAANAVAGNAAYLRVDSSSGAYPYPSVTTYDRIAAVSSAGAMLVGAFINPATVSGQANTPTPGNWIMIFVGQGRVAVNIQSAGGTPAVGDVVNADGTSDAKFTSTNTSTILSNTFGVAASVPSTANGCIVRVDSLLGVIPN